MLDRQSCNVLYEVPAVRSGKPAAKVSALTRPAAAAAGGPAKKLPAVRATVRPEFPGLGAADDRPPTTNYLGGRIMVSWSAKAFRVFPDCSNSIVARVEKRVNWARNGGPQNAWADACKTIEDHVKGHGA